MQKRTYGFNIGVCHTPAAWCTVQQHIGNGGDAHPLVVRHKGIYRSKTLRSRLAGSTVV